MSRAKKLGRDALKWTRDNVDPPLALAVALAALAIALRTGLIAWLTGGLTVRLGLYGPTVDRIASVGLAGALLVIILRLMRGRGRPNQDERESQLTRIATSIGLVTSITAAVAIILPATPYAASSSACRGAYLIGAAFYADTPKDGVNSRVGPGNGYERTRRYGGDCTLGFSGYCVGQPVGEVGARDSRWLIVNGTEQLVAAKVVSFEYGDDPDEAPRPPDSRCGRLGGLEAPGSAQISAELVSSSPPTLRLTADADDAPSVGYASLALGAPPTRYPFESIGMVDAVASRQYTLELNLGTILASLPEESGRVWIAARSCLSLGFPIGDTSVVEATVSGGVVTQLEDVDPPEGSRMRVLGQTACAGKPG